MESKELHSRVNSNYDKYRQAEGQIKPFEPVIAGQHTHYKPSENTLRPYLDFLNQILSDIKKPFSKITCENVVLCLENKQNPMVRA
jgi:hypothetical protein